VTRFRLDDSPQAVARIILSAFERDSAHRLRRRVRREFTWGRLLQTRLIPLLEARRA
jgi:hypothetical protein